MVKTGLDHLPAAWPRALRGARVGLVCHPASVNTRFQHASDVLLRLKQARLAAFFGPQHGIRGETQANMIEWEGYRDRVTGLPVYSLYGEHRKPQLRMLEGLDALAVDLFDVGARYYTYIWTLYLCMESCREAGKTVVVLDRPFSILTHLRDGGFLWEALRKIDDLIAEVDIFDYSWEKERYGVTDDPEN